MLASYIYDHDRKTLEKRSESDPFAKGASKSDPKPVLLGRLLFIRLVASPLLFRTIRSGLRLLVFLSESSELFKPTELDQTSSFTQP